MEYTQEQLNAVAQSYTNEILRLLEIKVNKDKTIFDLKQKIQQQEKEIESLKKKKK